MHVAQSIEKISPVILIATRVGSGWVCECTKMKFLRNFVVVVDWCQLSQCIQCIVSNWNSKRMINSFNRIGFLCLRRQIGFAWWPRECNRTSDSTAVRTPSLYRLSLPQLCCVHCSNDIQLFYHRAASHTRITRRKVCICGAVINKIIVYCEWLGARRPPLMGRPGEHRLAAISVAATRNARRIYRAI